MPNKCKHVLDQIDLVLDDDLIEKDKKSFTEHIASCESCRDEFNTHKYMISLIKEIEDCDPPKDLKNNVMEMIKKENFSKKEKINDRINVFSFRPFAAVAAGLIVIFSVYLLFGTGLFTQNMESDTAAFTKNLSDETGEATFAQNEQDANSSTEMRAVSSLEPTYFIQLDTDDVTKTNEIIKELISGVIQYGGLTEQKDDFRLSLDKEQIIKITDLILEAFPDAVIQDEAVTEDGILQITIKSK